MLYNFYAVVKKRKGYTIQTFLAKINYSYTNIIAVKKIGKDCLLFHLSAKKGNPIREASDEKFDFVYEPVLKELNYDPVRADKETTPNSISRDIINRVINSDLILADVTDENPNVFYELAVRNAVKKPVIIMMAAGQKLPFDIKDKRAIVLDMTKNRQWLAAKEKLKAYIQNAENDPDSASESILSGLILILVTNSPNKEQEKELEITIGLKDIRAVLIVLYNR